MLDNVMLRVDEESRFVGVASAEFHDSRRCELPDDTASLRGEDRTLGARRIVLRQARDLVEQLRAALIVEELWRQFLPGARQTLADIGEHRVVRRSQRGNGRLTHRMRT